MDFSSAPWTEILAHVADTDRYSGGATAAALSAALATSTTRLVVNVDRRRKSLRSDLPSLEYLAAQLEELETRFVQLASDDAEALAQLMNAYSTRNSEPNRYFELLCAAADSTIDIASAILELLDLTSQEIGRANRFIVSDLAASASLARGALGAIDPTCEINLKMIEELRPGGQDSAASSRRAQYQKIRDSALTLAQEIIEASNSKLLGATNGGVA